MHSALDTRFRQAKATAERMSSTYQAVQESRLNKRVFFGEARQLRDSITHNLTLSMLAERLPQMVATAAKSLDAASSARGKAADAERDIAALEAKIAHLRESMDALTRDYDRLAAAVGNYTTLCTKVSGQAVCEAQIAELTARGLELGALTDEWNAIQRELPAAQKSAQTDPFACGEAFKVLCQRSVACAANIAHLHKVEVETNTWATIAYLEDRIQEVRAVPFAFALPLLPDQQPVTDAATHHLCNEFEPDAVVEGARAQVRLALQSLAKNDHAQFDQYYRNARVASENATTQVDSHVSAQEEMERRLLPTFHSLKALESRVNGVERSYNQLSAAGGNGPQEAYQKLREGLGQISGGLYALQAVYARQHFVSGRETLRRLTDRIVRTAAMLNSVTGVSAQIQLPLPSAATGKSGAQAKTDPALEEMLAQILKLQKWASEQLNVPDQVLQDSDKTLADALKLMGTSGAPRN